MGVVGMPLDWARRSSITPGLSPSNILSAFLMSRIEALSTGTRAAVVLNNEISVSYAALKDMIAAGYVTTLLILVPVLMVKWQEKAKRGPVEKPAPYRTMADRCGWIPDGERSLA